MKTMGFLVLMFLSTSTLSAEVISSTSINLGSDFRIVNTIEKQNALSAKTSRLQYLYHKDRKLSHINKYSISPSRLYVVYSAVPSGGLFLYSSADNLRTKLTDKFIAPIRKISWNETYEVLTIYFSGGTPSRNFAME